MTTLWGMATSAIFADSCLDEAECCRCDPCLHHIVVHDRARFAAALDGQPIEAGCGRIGWGTLVEHDMEHVEVSPTIDGKGFETA